MSTENREPVTQRRFGLAAVEGMLLAAFGITDGDAPDIRWRIKQMQRHDWPDTTSTDVDLRKGYTPRQSLRILTAAALLDAGYGPTDAIRLARENENAVLAIMATGVGHRNPKGRMHALHRPGAVGPATNRLSDPSALTLTPITGAEIASMLAEEQHGRGAMLLDLAGMAGRGVRKLLGGEGGGSEGFDALFREAAHATTRGHGYVASDHPLGDRYLSPRRRGASRGAG
ncbi:hypothetical protein ASG29_06545 [Sphingomonas sp. Leaf412]|uniref:hypothetical protein n=1 Tax=Sphingomonas sp. Leaf412 TaxID=1736370 RepID=UPI000700291C|nr:hypothetical protein [Sphingomonas sp. Leaf412]KQT33665.1 hypothetical protein ASG29_06545 [Sphingomonas sp. Leaf412]